MGFPIGARFAHPDAGYKGAVEQAAKYLEAGRVYTVRRLDVGRSDSTLWLDGPGLRDIGFSTVMFEPAELPGFEDEEDGKDQLDEHQRWQVDEAALLLAAWDREHGPEVIDRERVLADQVRALLGVIGQAAPEPASRKAASDG
jgi:hypothetical protein